MLESVASRLSEMGVSLKWTDAALAELARIGYDPAYGARPLRRAIRSAVEDVLSEKLLDGTLKKGGEAEVSLKDGKIAVGKA
jgi:ATP-dependent Clp protease ATP-binding subunit ClpC